MATEGAVRPSARQCICGRYPTRWLKNYCATECCWSKETCPDCGRVYGAVSGELLHSPPGVTGEGDG